MKKKLKIAAGAALFLTFLLAFTFPNVQDMALAQPVATAGATTEVLVLASAAVEMPRMPNRAGIEIQNNGPNAIWCAIGTSAAAVVNKCRQIAASGGTWSLAASNRTRIFCRAATADQVTGAATDVSEFQR